VLKESKCGEEARIEYPGKDHNLALAGNCQQE